MATRHYTEIETIRSERFRIEVDDSEWASGATEILSGSEQGFTLNYPTSLGKMPGMMPSEFTYWVSIQNNGQGNLISDLAQSAEGRFRVVCYKWDGAAWALWWGGVVAPNIAEYQDLYYPYVFEISAVCGLSYLRNIDYNDDGGAYADESKLIEIVAKILKKLAHVPVLWGASGDFIRTIVDYYEAAHTYADDQCPLYYTEVNERAFYTIGSKGVKKWMRCDKVLSNILERFNCQMYQVSGFWLIQQLDERSKASFYARQYDFAISAPIAAPSMYGKAEIDPGDPHPRLTGGKYDWLTSLKSVKVAYNAQERRNLLDHSPFSNYTVLFEYTFAYVDYEDGATALRVRGTIKAQMKNISFTPGNFLCPRWSLRINVGSHYLKREITYQSGQVSAGATEWTTSGSGYQVTPGVIQAPATNAFFNVNTPFDFVTPLLVASGELRILVAHDIALNTNWETYWDLDNLTIETTTAVSNDVEYEMLQPDGSGVEAVDFVTQFGDGVTNNSAGRLLVGGAGTAMWGLGGGPYDKPLIDLASEQMLKGLNTPKKRMRGAVIGSDFPIYHILDDGEDEWAFIGGTYTARTGVWRGEWIKLDPGDATYDPPIIVYTDTFPPVSPGENSNPGGFGSSGLENLAPATLEPLSASKTSATLSAGSIASVPVASPLSARAFVSGQALSIVNPANGHSDTLTVTADSADGDTSISVSGSLTDTYGEESFVMVRLDNYTLQGGVTPINIPSGTAAGQILRWNDTALAWEIYAGATDGHVLTWDSTNGWQAEAPGGGGITALTGDVTATGPGSAAATIASDAVTFAKMQNIATDRLLGRDTAGTGDVEQLALNATLEFDGAGNVRRAALTGDVTASAGSNATTIANNAVTTPKLADDAVTYAKLQNVAANNVFLGNDNGTNQNAQELSAAEAKAILGIAGTSGRLALWTAANTLGDDAAFTFDAANDRMTITGTVAGSGANSAFLNLNSGAITGTTEFVRMSGNINGNLYAVMTNAHNASGNSHTIFQIATGGGSAGDPIVQFTVSGVMSHAMGLDNSDSDKFKITPNSSTPGGNANASLVGTKDTVPNWGVNTDAPAHAWDVAGVSRAEQFRGTGNLWADGNITFHAGAGTGPSISSISGGNNFFQITFAVGTSPTAGADVFTATYPKAFGTLSYPVFSPRANDDLAGVVSSLYVRSGAAGSLILAIEAGVSMPASTTVSLTFVIMGY